MDREEYFKLARQGVNYLIQKYNKRKNMYTLRVSIRKFEQGGTTVNFFDDSVIKSKTVKDFVKINEPNMELGIIKISIIYEKSKHANILIINKKFKTVELYEPHGFKTGKYYDFATQTLKKLCKENLPEYTFKDPEKTCPYVGFQSHDQGAKVGFCIMWSMFMAQLRIKYHDIPISTFQKMISKIYKELKSKYDQLKKPVDIRDNPFAKFMFEYILYLESKIHHK